MQIQVGKYALTPETMIAGTAGSYGFEHLSLQFDPFWDTLSKKLVFETEDGQRTEVLVDDAEIPLPREVTRSAGVCRFAVVGYEEEKIVITLAGELLVLDTISSEGAPAEEVTPSLFSQILTQLERLKQECNQLWQALCRLREDAFVAKQKSSPVRGIPRVEERRFKETAVDVP